MKNTDDIHTNELPAWVALLGTVTFAEGEGEGGEGGEGGDGGDDKGGSEDDDDLGGNTDGLKSALQKERLARRDAERARKAEQDELALLRKEKEERELSELDEIQKAQARAEKAEERAKALAANYARDSINAAIRESAKAARFADPDDAVALVARADIAFTQDDENPEEVTVDASTVDKVVKDLATRKPHYLKTGTDDGEPSGSSFSTSGNNKKKATEDELRDKYPSLR